MGCCLPATNIENTVGQKGKQFESDEEGKPFDNRPEKTDNYMTKNLEDNESKTISEDSEDNKSDNRDDTRQISEGVKVPENQQNNEEYNSNKIDFLKNTEEDTRCNKGNYRLSNSMIDYSNSDLSIPIISETVVERTGEIFLNLRDLIMKCSLDDVMRTFMCSFSPVVNVSFSKHKSVKYIYKEQTRTPSKHLSLIKLNTSRSIMEEDVNKSVLDNSGISSSSGKEKPFVRAIDRRQTVCPIKSVMSTIFYNENPSSFELPIDLEKLDNNYINFSLNQREDNEEEYLLGEGNISITLLCCLLHNGQKVIHIPIYNSVEEIFIGNLQINPIHNIKEFHVKQDILNRNIYNINIFKNQIQSIQDCENYLAQETMNYVAHDEDPIIRKNVSKLTKSFVDGTTNFDQILDTLKDKSNSYDELKYFVFITTLNRKITPTFFEQFSKGKYKLKMNDLFAPFVYSKDYPGDKEEIINIEKILKTKETKFNDKIQNEKKYVFYDAVIQLFIKMINGIDSIKYYEEMESEFISVNFHKFYEDSKERIHKSLAVEGGFNSILLQNMDSYRPVTNHYFIINQNLILNYLKLVSLTLTKCNCSATLTTKNFKYLSKNLSFLFLNLGSRNLNVKIMLCYYNTNILSGILQVLIQYVQVGSLLKKKRKTDFFHQEHDKYLSKFFFHIMDKCRNKSQLLSLVLKLLYYLLLAIQSHSVFQMFNIINIKLLFRSFIANRIKNITYVTFKDWFYFFFIIKKASELSKFTGHSHIDFINFDWAYIFDNTIILYSMVIQHTYLEIPSENYLNLDVKTFIITATKYSYMSRLHPIQIQMNFFNLFHNFSKNSTLIMNFYKNKKRFFYDILKQIVFLLLFQFNNKDTILCDDIKESYFKLLVTLLNILYNIGGIHGFDIEKEVKHSLKLIFPNKLEKLEEKFMENFMESIIQKLKKLSVEHKTDQFDNYDGKIEKMVKKLIGNEIHDKVDLTNYI